MATKRKTGWQSPRIRKKAAQKMKAKLAVGNMPIRDYTPRIQSDKEARAMQGIRYD